MLIRPFFYRVIGNCKIQGFDSALLLQKAMDGIEWIESCYLTRDLLYHIVVLVVVA
jgi:hypothetical protein